MKRPYCYPYKGKRIGYGYIKRGRKEARNAYRECRKNKKLYGASFDNSELWNLDITFCNFIHTSEINKSEYIKSIIKSEQEEYVRKKYSINPPLEDNYEKRQQLYSLESKYIDDENEKLRNDIIEVLNSNKDLNEKVCNFIAPRLKAFKDMTHGYPAIMTTFESWKNYIQECIDEIEQNRTFNKFYDKIFYFWD